ncbi:hypothetical protein [Scandinavium hiltneri]|nr:hypothetical protein [Scandinavium hiltneri]
MMLYARLVYDINEDWSAYVSYTNIFQPQDKSAANGRYQLTKNFARQLFSCQAYASSRCNHAPVEQA